MCGISVPTARGVKAGASVRRWCFHGLPSAINNPSPSIGRSTRMPGGVRVLLSDATAAVTDDIAADVVDELDEDIPDLDEDELDDVDSWPEGDLEILSDLGVAEDVLSVICDDQSLWASEQLHAIATELGFEEALADETGVEVDDADDGGDGDDDD